MSALDALQDDVHETIREVLSRRDAALLRTLEEVDEPSRADRERAIERLASEFDEHVGGPGWEPTPHGKRVDDALGAFLVRFPVEPA